MTQPARKKETATQLALLEAELTAARRVTARHRVAVEKAEKRLDALELVSGAHGFRDWQAALAGLRERDGV